MRFLRDNPISRYFAAMAPIDRATFLIVAGLSFAFALTVHGLWARWAQPEPIVPAFTAPPFELRTVRT